MALASEKAGIERALAEAVGWLERSTYALPATSLVS